MGTKVPPTRAAKAAPKLRNTEVQTWALPGIDEVLVQDPLTFIEKHEFFSLIARALEQALARGIDMRSIVSLFGIDSMDEFRRMVYEGDVSQLETLANDLLSAVMRILAQAPELMTDAYLLFLSIPPERRHEILPAIRQMDDDTGFGIFQTFVDQNASTLRDFLPRWQQLLGTIVEQTRNGTPNNED